MRSDPLEAKRIMGTAVTIAVPGHTASHPAVVDAFEELRLAEATFSTFIPNSQIAQIADGRLDLDDAATEVKEVLAECERVRAITRGSFDHYASDSLDPAGYVKGWAVDRAAEVLEAADLGNYLIWAGGDVRCGGHPPDADAWTIGIRDPEAADRAIDHVELVDGAVATSARYERGDHIRGACDTNLASVSVVGPRLGLADALSTAVFAAGLEAIDWMAEFPDYNVIAATKDRRILRTAPR